MDQSKTVAKVLFVTIAAFAAAPASAQSGQEAQRQLFVCMQKANNLELKDDKKDEFIKNCVEQSEKSASERRGPT